METERDREGETETERVLSKLLLNKGNEKKERETRG